MKVNSKRVIMTVGLVLTVCMMVSLVGCSQKASLAGVYVGTAGSYLKLSDDGTCIYSEDDATGTGTGTWTVEEDMIYINVSNINYTVYGNIEDAEHGILLQSNSSSWTDEYFVKQD